MNFEDLKNPEFQERLKSAQSPDELLAIAREEGFELSDLVLEGVSGGEHVPFGGKPAPPVDPRVPYDVVPNPDFDIQTY